MSGRMDPRVLLREERAVEPDVLTAWFGDTPGAVGIGRVR
jgi:hypothetical protein